MLINEVNEVLKYQSNINGFAFIYQDREWTLANGSLNCSLFYEDLLQVIEQDNVKLGKSITLTVTPRHTHLISLQRIATLHKEILQDRKSKVTFLFPLNESDFPLDFPCW